MEPSEQQQEEWKAFGEQFARTVTDKQFDKTHGFFAPWLQAALPAGALTKLFKLAREDRPPQHTFGVSLNTAVGLSDLRGDQQEARNIADYDGTGGNYGPPSFVIAPEITDQNFQCWMCVEFYPDEELDSGFDLSFQLWLMLVRESGELRVGYLEPSV
jgi:hypothetical protein